MWVPFDGLRTDVVAAAPWEVPNWGARLNHMGCCPPRTKKRGLTIGSVVRPTLVQSSSWLRLRSPLRVGLTLSVLVVLGPP